MNDLKGLIVVSLGALLGCLGIYVINKIWPDKRPKQKYEYWW